ncbi:membrane protein insertase YidC [Streptacidiphilus pinicola]|uniref:Membrane protein insertase YidC n=1 Tax=Streptacidiphilus pinicola TaxID=2219663 RepID=A0A2X0JBK1_9ACTN|nr:membrane protein insertase YidC [Streptacidiphilus pinicola]RAG84918.1 membrane protein insertase YidC [Streptacidiphilus pinicola]
MGPFDTILSPLYYVVSWLIITFHTMFSQVFPAGSGWAWGLSIVLLVLVVRAAMIPIFTKQIKSMRTMQALQPKMKVIQERYKNDRQRQSEEMMKLYKDAGTNPAASCLPMLVQIPIGAALYGVLRNVAQGHAVGVFTQAEVVSAQHAHIFGAEISQTFYGSGSTTVKIVTAIFIALMCVTQFMTTRQIMTKNVDLTVKTPYMQQQKMMMYFLPLIYVFTGPAMPVGVLIYMFTTNIWTLGQQLVIIRNNPTPGSIAWKERQARLKAAGKLNADGTEIKGIAALVKGAQPVEDAEPEPEPVRQQPKRQSKAQRASGGGQQQRGKGQQGGGGGTKTAPSRGRATAGGGNRNQGGGQSPKKKS